MALNAGKHNRRSIRLKGYDYSNPGKYSITICTHSRQCLFGNVADREMALNDAGKMVDTWWNKITEKFPNALLDVYQIMPNHFHAIVGITDPNTVGADPRVCPYGIDSQNQGGHADPPQHGMDYEQRPASIPGIVQWFKTMTTNKYIRGVREGQFLPFDRKLWQRNYYEHIIRNEKSLQRIRNYIINNPGQWEQDRNHPDNF